MEPKSTRSVLKNIFASFLITAACLWSYAPAQAETKAIRVGYVPIGTMHSAVPVLVGAKMAELLGIKVNLVTFASGPALITSFLAGDLDFVTIGDTPFLSLVGRAPGKFVAINTLTRSYWLTGLIVKKDSPYKSIEDLKGKKIAVPVGSVTHQWLLLLLQSHHMTDKDVNLLNMVAKDAVPALKAGQIDGFAWGSLTGEEAEHEGWGRMIEFTKDAKGNGVFSNGMFLCSVHVLRKEFGEQNPKLLDAWESIYITADQFAMDHVVATSVLYAKEGGVSAEVAAKAFLNEPPYPNLDDQFTGSLEQIGAFLRKHNIVKNLPTDIRPFLDLAPQEAAKKKGIEFEFPPPLYKTRGDVPGAKIDWSERNVPIETLLKPYVDGLKRKGVLGS